MTKATDNTKYRSARVPDRDLALSDRLRWTKPGIGDFTERRLAGPMGLLDRRAVTVSYRFPAVAEPAGCQRTITPFYGESAQSTATSQVFDGVPRRVIPLRTTVARLRAIVASNRRGPGSSTSMRRLRRACDSGRKRRRSPRVSKKVIARRDYLI